MTIMVESSRSFLFTEYARGGCGTFHSQGTDPKVWDALPVSLYSFCSLLVSISAMLTRFTGQVLKLPRHQADPGKGQDRQGHPAGPVGGVLRRQQVGGGGGRQHQWQCQWQRVIVMICCQYNDLATCFWCFNEFICRVAMYIVVSERSICPSLNTSFLLSVDRPKLEF